MPFHCHQAVWVRVLLLCALHHAIYHTVALQATFQSVRQVHRDLLTPGLGVLAEHFGTHIAFGFLGPGTPRCHL